jgi:hypothetical protein
MKQETRSTHQSENMSSFTMDHGDSSTSTVDQPLGSPTHYSFRLCFHNQQRYTESVQYPALAGGTTYECYAADAAKPLQSVVFSNIFQQTTSSDETKVFHSGKEHQRDSFMETIFTTGLDKGVFRKLESLLGRVECVRIRIDFTGL